MRPVPLLLLFFFTCQYLAAQKGADDSLPTPKDGLSPKSLMDSIEKERKFPELDSQLDSQMANHEVKNDTETVGCSPPPEVLEPKVDTIDLRKTEIIKKGSLDGYHWVKARHPIYETGEINLLMERPCFMNPLDCGPLDKLFGRCILNIEAVTHTMNLREEREGKPPYSYVQKNPNSKKYIEIQNGYPTYHLKCP